MNLQYAVNVFSAETDELVRSIEISPGDVDELSRIMGWQAPEDAVYEYLLTPDQISSLEQLTGDRFQDQTCTYILSCSANSLG